MYLKTYHGGSCNNPTTHGQCSLRTLKGFILQNDTSNTAKLLCKISTIFACTFILKFTTLPTKQMYRVFF